MCEIFPEVDKCCLIFSLRLGLVFISVLSVMTGAITLSVIEHISDASYHSLKNVSEIRAPAQAFSAISQIIPSGITFMSVMFMLMGFVLLFAVLANHEAPVQFFVWAIFGTVVFGFIMVIAICFECMFKSVCTLSGMDWLSGSTVLVIMIAYMFVWIYFITVANSYFLNGD